MKTESPFTRSSVLLLIACAAGLFAATLLLHARGEVTAAGGGSHAPGTYSSSAVGCRGFYETLRRLGRPAVRGVRNTLAETGIRGTLILAEPDLSFLMDADDMRLTAAPRLLIVLPKWDGTPDEGRPGWLGSAAPVPLLTAQQTLALVPANAEVYRAAWPDRWAVNRTGVAPSGSGVAQLMRAGEDGDENGNENWNGMKPVVGSADAMLVGEVRDGLRRIWVLSDPDVMSNHGILKGENAAFMTALVDMLRFSGGGALQTDGGPLVFDETVHGFLKEEPSLLTLLFRFPFAVVTILLCCAAGLFAAAGAGRFGAPLPPKPALGFGREVLTNNAAHLLDYAGHHAPVLRRYVRMTIRSAARLSHLPPGQGEAELAELAKNLDRIGRARGVGRSCADILRASEARDGGPRSSGDKKKELAGLFACAWDIYEWKGELSDGSGTHRRNR